MTLGGEGPMGIEGSGPSETPEPFVDAERAATFLAMSRKTLLTLARGGSLPGHPIGRGLRKTWKFRISELESWMKEQVNCPQRLRSCSRRTS